jgi:hypothetical protein
MSCLTVPLWTHWRCPEARLCRSPSPARRNFYWKHSRLRRYAPRAVAASASATLAHRWTEPETLPAQTGPTPESSQPLDISRCSSNYSSPPACEKRSGVPQKKPAPTGRAYCPSLPPGIHESRSGFAFPVILKEIGRWPAARGSSRCADSRGLTPCKISFR